LSSGEVQRVGIVGVQKLHRRLHMSDRRVADSNELNVSSWALRPHRQLCVHELQRRLCVPCSVNNGNTRCRHLCSRAVFVLGLGRVQQLQRGLRVSDRLDDGDASGDDLQPWQVRAGGLWDVFGEFEMPVCLSVAAS
jgi:hypothetical protein